MYLRRRMVKNYSVVTPRSGTTILLKYLDILIKLVDVNIIFSLSNK